MGNTGVRRFFFGELVPMNELSGNTRRYFKLTRLSVIPLLPCWTGIVEHVVFLSLQQFQISAHCPCGLSTA